MPDYKILSDNELITLFKEGNHNAYGEIYHRYYYLMFVFAYKKLRDEEFAKDFVQELFTHIWWKRENLIADGNFTAYLYTSLRHKILNYFAHQKVESRYFSFLSDYAISKSNENADFLIRGKELASYIERQIQTLPFKMRTIFELSRKDCLSHKEIAHKLGTSEYNVSKQITNALRILKTKLGCAIFLILF